MLRGNKIHICNFNGCVGLIPGAHKGRGLGNKFLDDLRKADVLLYVVDALGSADAEGRPIPPGTYNPN